MLEAIDEDPGGIPLDSLGDVFREQAKLYRQVKRGTVSRDMGGTLAFMLTQMAAMLQDRRDSRNKQRLGVLWAEHQKQAGATAEAEH